MADSLAAELVARLDQAPAPDSIELSRALADRATALWRMRRIRDGVAMASAERGALVRERFEREGSTYSARCRLLASRIASHMALHARSAELAREVVDWAERQSAPDSNLVLDGYHLIGMAEQALSRPGAARAAFDRALGWAPAGALESATSVPLLSDRAVFLTQMGEFEEAESMLRRALRLAPQAGAGSDLLENVLSRLSTLQLRMGNLAESVESASRSLAATRARVGAEEVATLFARVRLANRLGEFQDHRGALEERRSLLAPLEAALGATHPTAINVRFGYAEELLALGELDSARVQVGIAREAMRSQPPSRSGNPLFLRFLQARIDRLSGHRERARDSLEAAVRLEAGDSEGEGAAALLSEYFQTVLEPSDTLALRFATSRMDSLAAASRVRHLAVWCDLLTARALAELRAGLDEAAWSQALAAEEIARRRVIDEVRALPDSRGIQLMDRYANAIDGLIAASAAAGDPEIAWDRRIRWRDLVSREITRRRPPRGPAGDTALMAAYEDWSMLQRRVARLVVSGAANAGDSVSVARYAEAHAAAEDAERRLARLAGSGREAATEPRLSEVRAALRPREALVGFALADRGDGAPHLEVFVARSGHPEVQAVALGPAERIGALVRAWFALLSAPPKHPSGADEARCRRAGAAVREAVWAPIVRALGEATVVYVVPDDAVEALPWLALPAPGGRYQAEEPLEIRVLSSEGRLIERPLETVRSAGLLVVGDPDFEGAADARDRMSPAGSRTRGVYAAGPCVRRLPMLPPLPSAREEALAISRIWEDSGGVEVRVGGDATESEFKRSAPGRAVVHLATHGVVIGDGCSDAAPGGLSGARGVGGVSPLSRDGRRATPRTRDQGPPRVPARPAESPWLGQRVWLALAGANQSSRADRDENDGLLTAEEVATLDLRGTDWVVLSACQSGAAEGWAREGVLGMRRAFHMAGARSVIASRWPVADEATRAWMVALFEARPHARSAGAAVREAAKRMIQLRRARSSSTHPFYWAAFSATGD